MKILIIEDDENGIGLLLRTRLNMLLARYPDAEVVLVGTLDKGVSVLSQIPKPDIIFLDLGLPDSDWGDTLARAPTMDDEAPVIIVTGHPIEKVRALLQRKEIEIIHKSPGMWDRIIGAMAAALARARSGNLDRMAQNLNRMNEIILADGRKST